MILPNPPGERNWGKAPGLRPGATRPPVVARSPPVVVRPPDRATPGRPCHKSIAALPSPHLLVVRIGARMDVSAEPLGIEPQEPIMPAFRRLATCVALTVALAAASARCPGQEPAPGKEPPQAKGSILRALGKALAASGQSPPAEAEPSPPAGAAGKPAPEFDRYEIPAWAPASGTSAPGIKHQERAVTGALVWLANHQMPDGR